MADSDKIRVVIVDDYAEIRENVRKLLQFENDMEVVGVARTGREGVEMAKKQHPEVVLMDINMPDMDGITATELIRSTNPVTQIVILSVQADPSYMRRAMLAGARDFLTKPPAVDELTSAIRRAGKMAREEQAKQASQPLTAGPGLVSSGAAPGSLGRIVTVYSPKGGVGCTMVAVNLAMALHNEETPVALVDANLQFGDVAVFLNEGSKNSVADLAPRADELDPEIVDEVMSTHAASGVKVLAAPSRPEYAENISGEQFGKVLQFLRRLFSYVIVDTSSTLTDATLAALDSADLVVVLTTQEIPAIKNARLFLDLADVLKMNRKRILFAMNKFDRRIGIMPEKISESFHQEVVAVLPFDDRVVIPSINRGVPFLLGDRSKPVARSLLDLAEAVRQRVAEMAGQEAVKAKEPTNPLKRPVKR